MLRMGTWLTILHRRFGYTLLPYELPYPLLGTLGPCPLGTKASPPIDKTDRYWEGGIADR